MFTRFRFTPLQIFVHVGSLVPMMILVWDYFNNNLTFNPIQEATLRTGKTALVLFVLSLACTPLNTLFGWRGVLRVRRPLGLYSFFYASVHFLIFVGLDYGFDINLILEAIFEKRYALVGFFAGVILLALAITSTKGWQRRLKKNWKKLHQLIYVAGLFVVIHYIWLVKSDYREPLAYGLVIAVLLILRIPTIRQRVSGIRYRLPFRPKIRAKKETVSP